MRPLTAPPSPRRAALLPLAVLVATGWLLRVVTTARGWFYWDDLTLLADARAATNPLSLVGRVHDGHLMPGAWLLEWFLAHTAPLQWPAAVALAAVLQLGALVAVARAVWLLVPEPRPAAVGLPFALYAFAPVAWPGSTWLAAAVNALPLHAAFALAAAHAVRAAAPGPSRSRHAALAAAAVLGGLVFSERALAVLPALVLVLGALALAARRADLRAAAAALAPSALVTALWAVLYLVARHAGPPVPAHPSWQAFGDLLRLTYLEALLPQAAGGPWVWDRWHPGPPFATPPAFAAVAGAAVLVALALWTWRTRGRAVWLWLPLAVYPLIPVAALALARATPDSAATIANTMRHVSEVPVLAAVCAALVAARPATRPPEPGGARGRRIAAAVAVAGLAVSCGVSIRGFDAKWHEQPARDYFATLRDEAAALPPGETLLDQPVGLQVLLPVVYPDNQLSRLIGGLDGWPEVAPYARSPLLADDAGHLRPAELLELRRTLPGNEPGCGTRVAAATHPDGVAVGLDGPLVERDWIVRLGYFASGPGHADVSLGAGDAVRVPLEPGLAQVTVRVVGDGDVLHVRPDAATGDMCIGESGIGGLVPGR